MHAFGEVQRNLLYLRASVFLNSFKGFDDSLRFGALDDSDDAPFPTMRILVEHNDIDLTSRETSLANAQMWTDIFWKHQPLFCM